MPHGPDHIDSAVGGISPAAESFEAQLLGLLPALRRYSRSLSRSDGDGDDLLQDSVEKVLANRGQWRGRNLRAWTLTIMTNLYRNGLRKRGGRSFIDIDEITELAAPDAPPDPLEHGRLDAALNTLPQEHRAILMLVVVEGFSYQEVATMLDIPIGTVMSRLSRARRRLSDLMTSGNVVSLRRSK